MRALFALVIGISTFVSLALRAPLSVDPAFQALASWARLDDPVGRIWRSTAVRTFFEDLGGYWPYQNDSGLAAPVRSASTLAAPQRSPLLLLSLTREHARLRWASVPRSPVHGFCGDWNVAPSTAEAHNVVDDEEEHWVKRELIVECAAKSRLPAIYPYKVFVQAGGLASYGIDIPDLGRRVANMADQILKGAKPSDIPVFQPTKFELVINLKVAKALGLTVPATLLQNTPLGPEEIRRLTDAYE